MTVCFIRNKNRRHDIKDIDTLVDGHRSILQARPFFPSYRVWPWSNPESVDASPLCGPWLSGGRDAICPRAVQLFVHQRQFEHLIQLGPVQPSAKDQLHSGKRRQERDQPVRIVFNWEVDQDFVRRRPRKLSLLVRVHHFRSPARRHYLSPLLLPRLSSEQSLTLLQPIALPSTILTINLREIPPLVIFLVVRLWHFTRLE